MSLAFPCAATPFLPFFDSEQNRTPANNGVYWELAVVAHFLRGMVYIGHSLEARHDKARMTNGADVSMVRLSTVDMKQARSGSAQFAASEFSNERDMRPNEFLSLWQGA